MSDHKHQYVLVADELDMFKRLVCECGEQKFLNHWHPMMNHLSEESLINLFKSLLSVGQLTPAQSQLADYVIQETNAIPIK